MNWIRRTCLALVFGGAFLLVCVPGVVWGTDNDGNGFEDKYEQALINKFCPSFVLDSRDQGVSPEPVEIMGPLWLSTYQALPPAGEYAGEALTTAANGDYSELDSWESFHYGPTWEGPTTCYATAIYRWLYHFDYAGSYSVVNGQKVGHCGEMVSGSTYDQPAGWYDAYANGNDYVQPGSAYPHTVYAHPYVVNGVKVIQYWFFYPFNDFINNHEADWEHINVVITSDDPATAEITDVVYYFHEKYYKCTTTQIENPSQFDCYVVDGSHPVVFVGGFGEKIYDPPLLPPTTGSGAGSHGSYPVYGHWNDIQEISGGTIPIFSVHEWIDGAGDYVDWRSIVWAKCEGEKYGVVLLKDPDYYNYNVGYDHEMSWLKAKVLWGQPVVHSFGTHLTFYSNLVEWFGINFGNVAIDGPVYSGVWEVTDWPAGRFDEYVGFADEFDYASDAQWTPPPPLPWDQVTDDLIEYPEQFTDVYGIVDIVGTSCVGDSSITVEWGYGSSPMGWSDDGIEILQSASPFYQTTYATWNTGPLPDGTYTIRVTALSYGGFAGEARATVDVEHRKCTVSVPGGQFLTVQEGVDWAEPGDTVVVDGPGDFVGNVVVNEGVSIITLEPNVTLVGVGDNPVLTVGDHSYPCTISGLAIKHQNGEAVHNGHGILIENASPVISDCVIYDNKADLGGGIVITGDSKPHFDNCDFEDNYGGGVAITGSAVDRPIATFTDCRFTGNVGKPGSAVTVEYPMGDPLSSSEDQPQFTRCRFEGNNNPNFAGYFGTVFVHYCDNVLFDHCVFADNGRAISSYTGGVIAGDFGGVVTNCTIAYNRENTDIGTDCFCGIDLNARTRTMSIDVVNSIFAFNESPAIGHLDPGGGGNVRLERSDFFQNAGCENSYPSDGDLISGDHGPHNFSADPVFCDSDNGDYAISAVSPCAAGGETEYRIGAHDPACLPPVTATLVEDDFINGVDHILNVCPQGCGDSYAHDYRVAVEFDHTVMTRTIAPEEVTIEFMTSDFMVVFDDDGIIYDPTAEWNEANMYVDTVAFGYFGGHGVENVDFARIMLDGIPIGEPLPVLVRSYELTGTGGVIDGIIELADFGMFGEVYDKPEKYTPEMDFNADGVIELRDFGNFGIHWGHRAPFPSLPQSPVESPRVVDCEIQLAVAERVKGSATREIWVDFGLENTEEFEFMVVSLKIEKEGVVFKKWVPNEKLQKTVLAAEIERDQVRQLFMSVDGSQLPGARSQYLGFFVFEVTGDESLDFTTDDFELLVGDVLLKAGGRGVFKGITVETHEDAKVVYQNSLAQNRPNPFNPQTTISYSLADDGAVSLVIYSVTGERVRGLESGYKNPGTYHVMWDGRDDSGAPTASGVYFYRLRAGDFVQTRKMVLLR